MQLIADPKLERINTIYDVISKEIREDGDIKTTHISMLPEAGTYNKQRADGMPATPETLEEAKAAERSLGHAEYPDHLRFNTSQAEYWEWESKFKQLCTELLKPDTESQEVHLTVDTWSLGTAFFVRFLSNPDNRRFFIDNKIQLKGIHFIAPTTAQGTSFDVSGLEDKLKQDIRKFLEESAHNIHVTGNQHDMILGGKGKEEAEQMAEILGVKATIEGHSENDFLGSHYVSDAPAVHPAAQTSIEMMRNAR